MDWYEEEIEHLEKEGINAEHNTEIIFYGSSSIRLWKNLSSDFPKKKVINLGFGGSTLAACVWFFQRVMVNYQPKALVVYAGDNDLGDGRHPEEVFLFFQQLMANSASRFGNLPCYFISLKLSPSRQHLAEKFIYTNKLIADEIKNMENWTFIDVFKRMIDGSGNPLPDLYEADGLHLNEKGYQLWREIINSFLT